MAAPGKGIAAIILAKGKPGDAGGGDYGGAGGMTEEGISQAMDDLIAAIGKKDTAAACEAFRDLHILNMTQDADDLQSAKEGSENG